MLFCGDAQTRLALHSSLSSVHNGNVFPYFSAKPQQYGNQNNIKRDKHKVFRKAQCEPSHIGLAAVQHSNPFGVYKKSENKVVHKRRHDNVGEHPNFFPFNIYAAFIT